jgi:hypothetical protein
LKKMRKFKSKKEIKAKRQLDNKARMAEGMKAKARDRAVGVTYESCIDKPKNKKWLAQGMLDGALPAITMKQTKPRKVPGPFSSCKQMGHATKNNKKCLNHES